MPEVAVMREEQDDVMILADCVDLDMNNNEDEGKESPTKKPKKDKEEIM
jgi:hypothetical protein